MSARPDRTKERAALLARLLSAPIPTITVADYALLIDRGLVMAYQDVKAGRVQVDRRGRNIRVLTVPLLRSLGYEVATPAVPLA